MELTIREKWIQGAGYLARRAIDFGKTTGFRRYFAHTSWNMIGRIINIIVSFFVNIYVVRYLGPEQNGFLSYAVSFAGIFTFLAGLGIESLLYVDLVKYPEKRDALLGTSLVLKTIGATLTFATIGVALSILRSGADFTIAILIIAAANFFSAFNVVNLYFQSSVNAKPAVILAMASNTFLSALKILFAFMQLDVFFFVSIFLIEGIIGMIGNIVIYKKAGLALFDWRFDRALAKEFLFKSWPLMFSTASILIYSRIDQIIIKHLMDQASVGIYDVGVRLAEALYILPSIVVGSIYPAIINAGKVNEQHRDNRLIKLYAALFYASMLFIIPISIGADLIINLLYGAQFSGAAVVLQVYVWAGIGVSFGSIVNQYLVAQGYTKISFLLNIVNMAVNIALNVLFIPRYGLIGAAFATVVSYSFFPITMVFFKKTKNQIRLMLKAILLRNVIHGT